MKPDHRLLLALVLSTVLVAACDRDRPHTSARDPGLDAEPITSADTPAVDEAPSASRRAPLRATAPVKPDTGMSFTDMDKNMDSGISRDELANTEMLYQHFDEADTSGDGRLSFAEVERHRMDMTLEPQAVITDGRSIFQMDKNGDGGITRDELWNNEMLYRHFDEADADGDGKLSSAEVEVHRAAMAVGE